MKENIRRLILRAPAVEQDPFAPGPNRPLL
jgi:hypothetical protein